MKKYHVAQCDDRSIYILEMESSLSTTGTVIAYKDKTVKRKFYNPIGCSFSIGPIYGGSPKCIGKYYSLEKAISAHFIDLL